MVCPVVLENRLTESYRYNIAGTTFGIITVMCDSGKLRIMILVNLLAATCLTAGGFDRVEPQTRTSVVDSPFADAVFRGVTDKVNPVGYRVGEPIRFRFAFEGAGKEAYSGRYAIDWVRKGDDGKRTTGRVPIVRGQVPEVVTSLDRPGMVRLEAWVVDAKTGRREDRGKRAPNWPSWEMNDARSVFFGGGALVEPEKIVQSKPEPADFEEFWARQKRRLKDVPVQVIERRLNSRPDSPCQIWGVKVACAGPRPLTGALCIPRGAKQKSLKAVCRFHGYGTGVCNPKDYSTVSNQIVFVINAHGYDFWREKAYYEDMCDGVATVKWSYGRSPWQNEYPEGCYFNGMVLRLLRAYDFIRTLPEWDGVHLEAEGESQGGAQSLWAASLVDGITEVRPGVPGMADYGAETVPGRIVSGFPWTWAPGLAYYDTINHARHAKCPVKITRASLGDTACTPTSLAAIFNALPKNARSIVWVQGSQHGYVPPEPNQSIELPSGRIVSVSVSKDVFLDKTMERNSR